MTTGLVENWQRAGFGLYVHWPFCQSKCPYCDFNSHVAGRIDHKRWLNAYLAEIERLSALAPNRHLRSIFFGGGTPSLMPPDTVSQIIEAAQKAWQPTNEIEITLEANPTSVESGRFAAYREGGVNRISMGLQALNDKDLRRLGRTHTATEARSAFEIARSLFGRVSFDLIYARQDQTEAEWRQELATAIDLAVDHLSLYQLTIEDGTVFAARQRSGNLRGLPEEDLSVSLFEATQDICSAAGMPAYEVSNHARSGRESRHNLIYWRGGDYAALGPGAHGRLTLAGRRLATAAHRMPDAWLTAVESTGSGEEETSWLRPDEIATEYVLMSMRLAEGMDINILQSLLGDDRVLPDFGNLADLGMVTRKEDHLVATESGRLVLNAVIAEICSGFGENGLSSGQSVKPQKP